MVDMQNAGHIRYHEKAGQVQTQTQAANADQPVRPGTALDTGIDVAMPHASLPLPVPNCSEVDEVLR
jgi:hypothetical protein